MRKILTILILLCLNKHYAQTEISSQLKDALTKNYSDLQLENKLIMINHAVSTMDVMQQKINSEFERSATVYKNAKLKGGVKGIICVMIVDDTEQEITFKKSIKNCFFIRSTEINIPITKTMIIDSEGTVVYGNIDETKIYTTVQSLITR